MNIKIRSLWDINPSQIPFGRKIGNVNDPNYIGTFYPNSPFDMSDLLALQSVIAISNSITCDAFIDIEITENKSLETPIGIPVDVRRSGTI